MMGFRDPNHDPQDVADYWDEILHEFGIQAYLDAREEQYAGRDWDCDNVGDNGDLESPEVPECQCDDRDCYSCRYGF